jgi:hypothetical protein
MRQAALVTEQLAAILDTSKGGVDVTLRAVEALSVDDLKAVAFGAAVEEMLAEKGRERARREKLRRWTRQSRFGKPPAR